MRPQAPLFPCTLLFCSVALLLQASGATAARVRRGNSHSPARGGNSQSPAQASRPASCPADVELPPANYKVAVVGDIGNPSAPSVFKLIASQKPDLVVLPGDLGYEEVNPMAPSQFMRMYKDIVGSDVPLLITKGNHDEYTNHWEQQDNGYNAEMLLRGKERSASERAGPLCNGRAGINETCVSNGLFMVLATYGCEACLKKRGQLPWYGTSDFDITGQNCDEACEAPPGFAAAALGSQRAQKSLWRMCFWHKNQNKLMVGTKTDEVGYEPYEECREAGAFIVNGHEHVYSRSRTLTKMSEPTVDDAWSDPNVLRLKEGSSFVLVNGLGGDGLRAQSRCLPGTFPYGCNCEWGKIVTTKQEETEGVKAAVSFFEFHVDGNPCKASGTLLSDEGKQLDHFEFFTAVKGTESCCPALPRPNNMPDSGFKCDNHPQPDDPCTPSWSPECLKHKAAVGFRNDSHFSPMRSQDVLRGGRAQAVH